MSVKRTQQFIYFQNKARHYDHLQNIKPTIDNRRSRSTLNSTTIDTSKLQKYANNCKRKVPIMKRYELQQQNLGIINRIVGIMHSPKVELEKQGYSRDNLGNFRFTRSNFQKQEFKKDLANENLKLATKLIKTKPSIGTIHQWNSRYEEVKKHKRQISQYEQYTNSRGSFDIYTDRNFMPTHYMNFLRKGSNANDPSQEKEPRKSINFQVSRDKLFQLPKLKRFGRFDKSITNLDQFSPNGSVNTIV